MTQGWRPPSNLGGYFTEHGGVRIEDTLVVRTGAAELLTLTTKELLAI